jgi:hypothetical protein
MPGQLPGHAPSAPASPVTMAYPSDGESAQI